MGHAELEPEDIDETITPLYGAFKRTWAAFCATTSIHGLKYTRDEETNKIVRFTWLLIMFIMLICAIAMVITFYLDYQSNPTRLHVENDFAPVSSLYFPAISICPEVLYNLKKSREYIGTLKLPPNVEVKDLMDALRVNFAFIKDDETFNLQDINLMQSVLELNNISITEFQEGLRWDCDNFLYRCRFRNEIVDCNTLFRVARTAYGHCCSFNLNQTNGDLKLRYARPGLRSGLSVILFYKEQFDFLNSYSHGFRLLLHENNAFPGSRVMTKYVPLNEEVFLTMRAEETFCSTAVKELEIDERQCVFPDEYHLEHFPMYLGTNCDINSRILNMVKFCGCLAYYFDNNRTNDKVCTYTDVPCLLENFADIIGRFRNTQVTCPNSCETVNYDVQLTSAKLQLDVPTIDAFYDDIADDFSVAHMFMDSLVYRRVRHDLLSNTVSLVANLGSAFSLFVGMSMVSVVEIAYYFTVILRKYYTQEQNARSKLLFRREGVVKENRSRQ